MKYPQSGGMLRHSYSTRTARTAAIQRVQMLRRINERGSDISARTKLVLRYVREGVPGAHSLLRSWEHKTPTHRKAIRAALRLFKQYPVMCRALRTQQVMQSSLNAMQQRLTASAALLDSYPRGCAYVDRAAVSNKLPALVSGYWRTLPDDAEYFRPEELGL